MEMAIEDRDRLIRVETLVEVMGDKVDALTKAIQGNGQPGLLQRVTHMETMIEEHISSHAEEPARTGNIINLIAVVAMVVIAGIGWLK
jgi:hypothetical protein